MYQWNPEEYSRHSTEQAKWAPELIAKLNLAGTGKDIAEKWQMMTALIHRCTQEACNAV